MRLISTILYISFILVSGFSTFGWLTIAVTAAANSQHKQAETTNILLLVIAGYLLSILLLLLTCFF